MSEKKICLDCGEVIKGRSDKKFCNDICRNSYNNKIKSDTNNYVRNVNNTLRKNRRILEESLKGETTTVPKQKLVDKGYNFKFYTNHILTKNNHQYVYCYEFGYLLLDKDMVLIVRRKESN
jgi:hypothetical protein